SLDVLEHIPRGERAAHLAEILRVARGRAVLCCPLGTPAHVAAERALADWYAGLADAREPFLDEHLANGLPTEGELRELATSVDGHVAFQGDFREANALFRAQALAAVRGRALDRARFAWLRLTAPRDTRLRAHARP